MPEPRKWYRVVYSTNPPGAYACFSATSDADALAHAQAHSYGARIVSLVEEIDPHNVRRVLHD